MKLVSITCPNCGAKLQATPNAKMLTCNYCNCDVMVDDEIKRVRLVNAEQAGYEFEKGRRRAVKEAELEEKRLTAAFIWICCPYCDKDIKVKKELETVSCNNCGHSINIQLGANIRWAKYHEQMEDYRQAIDYYLKARRIDSSNTIVKNGIERINKKYKYSFISMEVKSAWKY